MPPVRRAPTRKPDGGGVKKASPRRLIKEGSLFTDWEAGFASIAGLATGHCEAASQSRGFGALKCCLSSDAWR